MPIRVANERTTSIGTLVPVSVPEASTFIGVVIFSALAVIVMNLVVDILYALLDPRIRTAG